MGLLLGTYEKPDGSPARGTLTFTLTARMIADDGDTLKTVVVEGPVIASLTANGSFAVSLRPTDDPAYAEYEGTLTYSVHESVDGRVNRVFSIVLPEPGPWDIADVAHFDVPPGVVVVPGGPTGPTGPASTVPGPAGATGPTGATGAASTVPGPTGPTGPAGGGEAGSGATGPTGPTGPTGAASTVPGPTGPRGATGATGAASTVPGPTGPASTVAGPTGPSGTAGATGPTGPASTVPGPTGPTGPSGSGGSVDWGNVPAPVTIKAPLGDTYIQFQDDASLAPSWRIRNEGTVTEQWYVNPDTGLTTKVFSNAGSSFAVANDQYIQKIGGTLMFSAATVGDTRLRPGAVPGGLTLNDAPVATVVVSATAPTAPVAGTIWVQQGASTQTQPSGIGKLIAGARSIISHDDGGK